MADYDVPANPGSWGNMPFPGQSDPQGVFAPNTAPAANNMPFPGQVDPRGIFAPRPAMAPRVLRNPAPAAAPMPVRPNINVPVGQVAQSGTGSLWDALRALFSGQPAAQAQAQGMTGMLQSPPRGQGARGTDALGNPFNRFG